MQSQVRFNRVLEEVPGSLGAEPSQGQRVPEKVAEAKPGQVHLTHGNPAEVFPALGFPARFRKICKNNTLRLLGIPPKLILILFVFPQQQNFAMGFLAQISSGAIRCSFNTRFWTRFRGVLVQIPREVPEGSGADTL